MNDTATEQKIDSVLKKEIPVYSLTDFPPITVWRSDRKGSLVWPRPEVRVTRNGVKPQDYSGLLHDYVPMRPHGCRSWEDGAFD